MHYLSSYQAEKWANSQLPVSSLQIKSTQSCYFYLDAKEKLAPYGQVPGLV